MNRGRFLIFVLLVLSLFGAGIYFLKTDNKTISLPTFSFPTNTPIPTPKTASESAELATVLRVVDGDTIELTDGRKVRYIGVDTPELHHPTKGVQCFGKEAMEKNKELVEGKIIKMKKDVSETDRYKRLLRYIWVPSASSGQEIFVNEYLAKEGFALQATFPPDVKYVELFRKAAEEARINNKGLWSACK
ncbi:MAG: thermonuclease family protein [Candidatus Roizmanbacteria bacterium]|nr:thermonuclease family protein [Candidatus Roizmanbacteria bacterium]